MFEVAVWLQVTLYSPDQRRGQLVYEQQYMGDETETAAVRCMEDALPWIVKASQVKRGTWMLDVACQVRHEEAEPAKGRE